MSRPYRKIQTRYVRFRSSLCRLFGCLAIPHREPGMLVSGSLTPDATGLIPELEALDINGRKQWSTGGGTEFPRTAILAIPVSGTQGYWSLFYLISATDWSYWRSTLVTFSEVPTPNIATGWAPFAQQGSGATPLGNPVITSIT